MRTAGILGGMGPGTTADFYRDINQLSKEQGYPDRPELLIWNVPLNLADEQTLLERQTGLEKYIPYLVSGVQRLEKAGADFIVVPCNTVHELYDEFSAEVDIPFLHIIEETSKHLEKHSIGKVAVLATGQTIGSKMYQDSLARRDIQHVLPDGGEQARLDRLVARLVGFEPPANDNEGLSDDQWLNTLVKQMVHDVGAVVLGCTDFHIMLDGDYDDRTVIDSMRVLAEATVRGVYDE